MLPGTLVSAVTQRTTRAVGYGAHDWHVWQEMYSALRALPTLMTSVKHNHQTKAESALRDAEATLRDRLLEVLPSIVQSGAPLFTNEHFNPHNLPEHQFSADAVELIDSALACVEMRKALEFPVTGSVSQLFIDACAESASSSAHRRGPRKLAAALLESLNHDG